MAKTEKKRGTLLTVWLAIMLILNTITALSYLLLNTSIASFYPDIPSWIFYLYGLLSLANATFVIFLFKWKKWALFAICASAAIIFIMNIAVGIKTTTAIAGLLGPIILYLIMRPKWKLFE